MKRKTVKQIHKEKYKGDPAYAKAYDALADEFSIAEEVIRARKHAKLTQTELTERMETTRAQIARMEGGQLLSMRTLKRLAAATGTKLELSLKPARQ